MLSGSHKNVSGAAVDETIKGKPFLTIDDFKDVIVPLVDDRIIDHPDLVVTKQLRKLGMVCFVYPNRVELKGHVNIGQTNNSLGCRYRQTSRLT